MFPFIKHKYFIKHNTDHLSENVFIFITQWLNTQIAHVCLCYKKIDLQHLIHWKIHFIEKKKAKSKTISVLNHIIIPLNINYTCAICMA